MDAILGSHSTDEAFQLFLDDWRDVMASRIDACRDAFARIPGVEAVILAGSNGTGSAWPLSDIDLIAIYAPEDAKATAEHVEQTRADLMKSWSGTGWRTGVDVGKLAFTTHDVEAALARDNPLPLLNDGRWYHSLDKGYQGQVLIEGSGQAWQLASWFTSWRFTPEVVEYRLQHSLHQAHASLGLGHDCLPANLILAYRHLLKAIQWSQIHLMERWGLRDNSLGRFGTRFEQAASVHGLMSLVEKFNVLTHLAPTEVRVRLTHSPTWVSERLDRSWKSRGRTGEVVTPLQNERDVLRVSTDYELREVSSPPYATWLAVPDTTALAERLTELGVILNDLA